MKLHKRILIIVAVYLISLVLIFVANWMRDQRLKNEAFDLVEINEISMYRKPIESLIEIPEFVSSDYENSVKSHVDNEEKVDVKNDVESQTDIASIEEPQNTQVTETVSTNSIISFTFLPVPNIDSSFKTYMPWQAWLKAQNSAQYKFFMNHGWVDSQGFVRCSAERDLGIPEDYYMVALGSYYGTTLGTKYRITLDTGKVFYAILGEFKANIHTNSTHQYSTDNNDIVEFVIDEDKLNPLVAQAGSANVYMPLNGKVAKIERIDFEQLK